MLCVFNTISAFGQDERFIRKLYSNKFIMPEGSLVLTPAKSIIKSDLKFIDINNDGLKESFFTSKRDGTDWFHLNDYLGNRMVDLRMDSHSSNSKIYKMKVTHISNDKVMLLLYFFQGGAEYLDLEARSKLYSLSMDKADFGNLIVNDLGYIWREHTEGDAYFRRDYFVKIEDLNNDGLKEIIVNYYDINRVFTFHQRKGWMNNF